MNKNIKKIISFAIIFATYSIFTPSTLNILEQRAYAYSKYEINTLQITSGVSVVPIYSSVSHDADYRVKKGEEIPIVIYSKISSNKTNFKLNTIETKAADVRVFVGDEKSKLSDIYSEINISEGESKSVYIRLYDSKNASDNDYSIEYELIVEREVNDDDVIVSDNKSEDDIITLKDYDDIYLNRLALLDNNNNKIDFAFDKTQPIYNINVDENVSYITVKAVPEQQSYRLLIDDKELDPSDDKDSRLVQLDKGKNVIKIRIISSDHERREYFLVVTRGKDNSQTSSNNTTGNINSQNVQTVGNWQYKKADGTLATGWTRIGNEWYYFDSTGALKTGWLNDNGKWYYLKESGAMAKDTVVNGYKIGSDGVLVTK